MTKAELIKAVATQSGDSEQSIRRIAEILFDTIKAAQSQGEEVTFNGFGTFGSAEQDGFKVPIIRFGKDAREDVKSGGFVEE